MLKLIDENWVLNYDYQQLIQNLYDKEQYQYLSFNLNHYVDKFKTGKELFIFKIDFSLN